MSINKQELGNRIKDERLRLGLSQSVIAQNIGVATSTISRYEKGAFNDIKLPVIEAIAKELKVSPSWLLGADVPKNRSFDDLCRSLTANILGLDDDETIDYLANNGVVEVSEHAVPVLGRVQAGLPIDAQEEILDWEEISPNMALSGEYFALQVKGDSMEPKFSEGDVVIVRQQEDAESGDIVIALIGGNDATIKKMIKYDAGGIALVASNPMYQPLQFSDKDIVEKPVHIIGKVVELRAKF